MSKPADCLFTNASIYTADPANPRAEAVAVRGNRIIFVGRAADDADLRGLGTKVINAGGRPMHNWRRRKSQGRPACRTASEGTHDGNHLSWRRR